MRRKVWSIGLMICLLLGMWVQAPQAQETQTESDYAGRARALMSALERNDYIPQEGETVTRAQFTATLMEALGYDTAVEEETSPFEDVSGQYTYAINRALEMGIATLQAQFRPDEAITYAEALKMGAVAAGYETKCNLSGGYPVGVLAVAQETGLSDKVSPTAWNGAITPQQALTILYNTLTIDRMQQVSYGETYTYEVREGETLLYQYFQLYTVEGIVTANGRTSLTSADGKLESGRVSIGSRQYLASEEAQDLLGHRVLAFIQETKEEIEPLIVAFTERMEIAWPSIDEFSAISGNRLEFETEEGKRARYTMSTDYDVIYNGKAYRGAVDETFLDALDTISLLDNNNDGNYEVMLAEKAKYLKVSRVNTLDAMIYDSSKYGNHLDFSDTSGEYLILDEEGASIALYQVEDGSILAAYVSEDGLYAKVEPCTDSVSGVVQEADFSNEILTIEDTVYKMTPEFQKSFAGISAGTEGTFYLGKNGKIVLFDEDSSTMEYGYVVKTNQGQGLKSPQVKLLNQRGELQILDLADRITVDGTSQSATQVLDILEQSQVSPLIRYQVNQDEKLTQVDTASQDQRGEGAIGSVDTAALPENNRLTLYTFEEDTSYSAYFYRAGTKLLYPKVNLSNTVVFQVPQDRSVDHEDKKYKVGGADLFTNDQSVPRNNIQIFDLDEYGNPKALLLMSDASNISINNTYDSAVIEKVVDGINEEGEACKKVTILTQAGKYVTYPLDTDIAPDSLKASGAPLCPGDIVRYNVSDGAINGIVVDFDASPQVMGKNTSSNAPFNGGSTNFQYQSGKLYSLQGTQVYLTPQPANNAVGQASYNYSWSTLRQFSINQNIIKVTLSCSQEADGSVKTTRSDVRQATAGEISTYLDVGENADYAVLRQNYLDPRMMVIYKIEMN